MIGREDIIRSMCLTWRHDYGMEKGAFGGMTDEERESLRRQMAQVFDNDIAPHMDFKKEPRKTRLVSDGIIQAHSFDFTDREKKRMNLALRYGPESSAMKDDGTFWESDNPRCGRKKWTCGIDLGNFLVDPSWTEQEREVKMPFCRFWIPVLLFVSVWAFSLMVLDFIRWLYS